VSHYRFPADRTIPAQDTPVQCHRSPVRYCKPVSAVFLSQLRSVSPAPIPVLPYCRRFRQWLHFPPPALLSVPALPSAAPGNLPWTVPAPSAAHNRHIRKYHLLRRYCSGCIYSSTIPVPHPHRLPLLLPAVPDNLPDCSSPAPACSPQNLPYFEVPAM